VTSSREGWIQKYQEQLDMLDPEDDAEQLETVNAVIAYLRSPP
jgi:hypothetical protein